MLIRRNSFVDYIIVFYNKSKWKFDGMYNGNIIDFWHIQENSTPIVGKIFKDKHGILFMSSHLGL